jgi:hypothetical protein
MVLKKPGRPVFAAGVFDGRWIPAPQASFVNKDPAPLMDLPLIVDVVAPQENLKALSHTRNDNVTLEGCPDQISLTCR